VKLSAKDQGERRQARRHTRAVVPTLLTHGHIRRSNAWAVLQAVRATGTTSRTRITEQTGLTAMSVHRLVGELRRRRLLVPAGTSPAGAVGRPSSLFRFNASIGYVIGFDVGNETTRAALADLDRNRLANLEITTADIEGDLPGSIREAIATLQKDARVRPDGLVGLAIGVAAITSLDGTIVRASQHRAWDGLALGALLRETGGPEVVVRQDDHLAALAELHGGACTGTRTAVVLDVGKGLGLGVITNAAVHAGTHGAAGRVALIPVRSEGPGDSPMVPLGTVANADGIIADYRRFGGSAATDGARSVFVADAAGDPAAARAIDLFAWRLGWLIGTTIAILDPEIVVVGGGISRSFERLQKPITKRVAEIVSTQTAIVPSKMGPEAVVAGAIDAAMGLADMWLQGRISA
jgi:predicted NBD/HSP70 family sugar kinase